MLVNTTLVKALYCRALLVTAWPQLWKATSAMGTRTCQLISSLSLGTPARVTMVAAATVSKNCIVKEAQRTHRRLGEKKRWNRLKMKDPTQKDMRDVPDLIHRVD